ncbi:putative hydrolase of the HAD superfamily [Larkinella arboricola]|uniref:Putative hydrolase of the HAD superfamily n=1 Tax=Larkinella arboricola TaxID=643671 RepID=A0A327X107_LARAB|nr:HAD-IA family hydrolase [Larkinella arboricola]RAK00161.1 putative hydrolase of the HAD superfamily [Larkinella arboricola]
MELTPIKFLFLDVGGVLLTNGWGHESRQRAAETFGFDYSEMDVLHDFIFDTYEMGRITLDEYLNTVVFNRPRDFTREDFKSFMFAQSLELPQILEWLVEWKKANPHIRIMSINNEGRELNEYRIKKFKLHRCFDAFISSCEVGMRKPDPGIFRLAMGLAQVRPEECLYFDDRLMLVGAARRLGIQALHHQTFEATKAILEKLNQEPINLHEFNGRNEV